MIVGITAKDEHLVFISVFNEVEEIRKMEMVMLELVLDLYFIGHVEKDYDSVIVKDVNVSKNN